MKCANCDNLLLSSINCPYCPNFFCSLSCLEPHYSLIHNQNLFHRNESQNQNNIYYFEHSTEINSIFYIKGILNTKINYDPIYDLKNFTPIYQRNGELKTVGSGSYGQVYLGFNSLDNKYYAIKHMNKKNIFSILKSLLNIQKEIDIQSKINHPNIVKLLYVKETETSYDLVMEYANGGNLFHYIRRNNGLSEDQSFSFFIQVVNAITFLHENDLIHRDIKPENILLFDNNVVKLCDFGWCVKLNGYQRGTFCGTTEYMSPELVNHQVYGKEIDTWSLGILLYELIHGYSPFKPNKSCFEPEDVMENIINHNLNFKKQISERCKKLIYGLLDSNIYNRYTVEDIFNSEFVKYYENLEKNKINNSNDMLYEENQKGAQINNILYTPKFEMNNNINIHMSMDYKNYIYNIQLPQRNKSFDKKIEFNKNNKGMYENYVKYANNTKNELYDNNSCNSFLNTDNNENLCHSEIHYLNNPDNFSNKKQNGNNNEFQKLRYNKTEVDFYEKDYMKSNKHRIVNEYSSYNENINYNKYINEFNYDEEKEKYNNNSNNNYFFDENNSVNNNIKNIFENNSEEHFLKLSYLSNNSQIFNDENKNLNEEPLDNYSNKNLLGNYLFNNNIHYLNNNHSKQIKTSLAKKLPLNNLSNDFNSNLSLSMQTPEKNFYNTKSLDFDSAYSNNSFITPNKNDLGIGNPLYKSYIKNTRNNGFNIDFNNSGNNNEKTKEKEPIDNIRKSPASKERLKFNNISLSLNKKDLNPLIKRIDKNKISKSINNYYKNINYNQSNERVLAKCNVIYNNYNSHQSIYQNEKIGIKNLKYKKSNTNKYPFIKNISKKPNGNKAIARYILKPTNKKENKYYISEIKNNISTNQNNTIENNEIKSVDSNTSQLSKKKIFIKLEEKTQKNSKNKVNMDENNKNSYYNKKDIKNDIKIVKIGGIYLGNSPSEINIMKTSNISGNSSNRKIINGNIKSNLANINYINYSKNNKIEKDKPNLIKSGIKKIYVYNNQLNRNNKNKIEKKLEDRSYDIIRNKGRLNYKKFIFPIKGNETKLINNISNLKNKNDDRNKTPENKSIFNPVKPNLLIESFKKELENKSNMIKMKYNIIKK